MSPLYRDFVLDRRDRYRGASFAVHFGPMEYDRQVLHSFSWGAWFWDPYRAMGMPRLQDIGMRPLYPVQLALSAALPTTMQAWHWNHLLHVSIKLVGLVLLCDALAWPLWIVVAASVGALLAEGSLVQFTDTTMLLSAAWLPLQLWLTLKAARRPGFTFWDAAWALTAALRALSFHPQYGAYYEVLVVLLTLRLEWGGLRARWLALVGRYAIVALLLAPALLPGYIHYLESGRRHIGEFDDWAFRRAYVWWNYGLRWADVMAAFAPSGLWLATAAALVIVRGPGRVLWPVFAAYVVFALFHAVPWLALPMWLSGKALLPFRLPQRVFAPFGWLGILLLAELTVHAPPGLRRRVAGALLFVGVACCAWQTAYDQRSAYIQPRWQQPLPWRLADIARAEPTHALFVTGPERMDDERGAVLNSNHADVLRIPAAHFAGQLPSYAFNRLAYRLPGMVLLPRGPTALPEWDAVVDVYAELGIGWILWDGDGEPLHPRLTLAGEEAGIRLYRVANARGIVYALNTVHSVGRPSTPAGVSQLVFALPSTGPFCYDCRLEGGAVGGPARLKTDWRAGDVGVEVAASRQTLLVLNENRSAGWRVTVDGAPAEMVPVNEAFQGVIVAPGTHVVRWQFESPGFFLGLVLGAVGFVALLVTPVSVCWRRHAS